MPNEHRLGNYTADLENNIDGVITGASLLRDRLGDHCCTIDTALIVSAVIHSTMHNYDILQNITTSLDGIESRMP